MKSNMTNIHLKFFLQFRCTNCGEESDKWIYLSQDVGNSSYIYVNR